MTESPFLSRPTHVIPYEESEREHFLRFVDRLLSLFFDSPEGEELIEQYPGIRLGQIREILSCMVDFDSTDFAEFDPALLSDMLLEHSPRQAFIFDVDGDYVIGELRAFFRFLHRHFDLENAAYCAAFLEQKGLAEEFDARMNDPENFGIEKCMIFLGQRAGFDMSDQMEMMRFEAILNEAIAGTQPLPHDGASRFETSPFIERILTRYDGDAGTLNFFERLMNAGAELTADLHQDLLTADAELLIQFVDDRDLAIDAAPGDGWIPIHATRILAERRESAAIPALIAAIDESHRDDLISCTAVDALEQIFAGS